jgi:hypothetical protein
MTLIDASSARSGTCAGYMTAATSSRNQLPRATRRYTVEGARGDRVDSAQAPKERGKQAMKGLLLIPAAVAVILVLLYLVTRRDDEGDDRGILGVLIDLLRWW